MLPPRRFLPSLSLLAAFEAASRTGSITNAASELGLTQGAVSRQILALEQQLGVDLFMREKQKIRLTLAGEGYVREIREALRRISTASLNLRANPHGGSLNIAVPSTFGDRWLVPRLADFLRQHPGISVNIVTRSSQFDFRLDSVDAAIYFGDGRWQGADLSYLMRETIVLACSQSFLADHQIKEPSDLLNLPLLHITTRPDAWEIWLRAHDVSFEHVHGMLFDQFSTVTEAASAGLGVALVPAFLIAEELASGKLVDPMPGDYESGEAYYLAASPDRLDYQPLMVFKEWITTQAMAAKRHSVD
jgi:LysR family glycine cleavage system transcriptional activator